MAPQNIIKEKILRKMAKFLYFTIFLFAIIFDCFAVRQIEEKNYFASLRGSQTNVRAGPGPQYPVKFIFKARLVPIKVLSEYDNWNEIEDYEGQTGWVSQNLLTKKRSLMVLTSKEFINMHSKKNEKSRILYKLKNFVVGEYLGCEKDWCMIKISDKKGWVKSAEVFGD